MKNRLLVVALSMVSVLFSSSPSLCLAQGETKAPTQTEKLQPAPAKESGESPKKALTSSHPREVIKYGSSFLLLDDMGLMPPENRYGYGLYHDDTRFLKVWDLRINDKPLTLLYKNTDDGYAGRYIYENTSSDIPNEKVSVERNVLIRDRVLERLRVTNYDTVARDIQLSVLFDSDFADMFEVRGQARKQWGKLLPRSYDAANRCVKLSYRGLDDKVMEAAVQFSKPPDESQDDRVIFKMRLQPHQVWDVETAVGIGFADADAQLVSPMRPFQEEKAMIDGIYTHWRDRCASISTDNPTFNQWIERNYRDLFILIEHTPRGEGIAAGVPWFAVAFGRDQEITSLETLPFIPSLARNVLTVLCNYQGSKSDPFTEEEPGAIMHELRLGEMARLKEIPFIPYYGTVDATPLFIVLLGRYVAVSGDREFAKRHWSNVTRGLDYIDQEIRDSGYLRYGWKPGTFLSNKGWKDSGDSVMYANGEILKQQPIALCEVQGYLYAAWMSAASMADVLHKKAEADGLRAKAESLRSRFQKDFWMDKEQFVALALDGKNKQCDVVSSNPGHLLSTGILSHDQENSVIQRLMKPDMFSGWGVRTLSEKEVAYNPLSYHDGSIWPHDNGMITYGFGCTKRTDLAARVLGSMFHVAQAEPDFRLPELFCGFASDYAEKPIWYPVSCSPQAWAAGSMFMMLQGSLGLNVTPQAVTVDDPQLPDGVSRLEIRHIFAAHGKADLTFTRVPGTSKVEFKCRNY